MTSVDPGNRIYLDSNIFIYAFEDSPTFRKAALVFFQRVAERKADIFTSQLVLPEILPKPMREGRLAEVQRYTGFLHNTEGVHLIPVSHEIIHRTVDLRARYELKTIDALHVASAIEHDCTAFISVDKSLKRVEELPVISLRDDLLAL